MKVTLQTKEEKLKNSSQQVEPAYEGAPNSYYWSIYNTRLDPKRAKNKQLCARSSKLIKPDKIYWIKKVKYFSEKKPHILD